MPEIALEDPDVEIEIDVTQVNVDVDVAPSIDVEVLVSKVEIKSAPPPPINVDVELVGSPGKSGKDGAPGPMGPSGPQGPPGIGALSRYTHNQFVMSPTWIVEHNLGCHPTVITEDAVGNVIYGSIVYIDNNMLTVGFAYSITGWATCL